MFSFAAFFFLRVFEDVRTELHCDDVAYLCILNCSQFSDGLHRLAIIDQGQLG
jgi:hypothetical protein